MEKDPPVLELSYSVGEHQMHQKGADVQKDHYREIIFDGPYFLATNVSTPLPLELSSSISNKKIVVAFKMTHHITKCFQIFRSTLIISLKIASEENDTPVTKSACEHQMYQKGKVVRKNHKHVFRQTSRCFPLHPVKSLR